MTTNDPRSVIGLTNNLPVPPDEHGLPLQRIAAEIKRRDPTAVVPHSLGQAQAMLDGLDRGGRMESAQGRRVGDAQELYNSSLRVMSRARQLGLRPPDAKLVPPEWNITADELQVMRETIAELHADVEAYEQLTPDQRHIKLLEASTKARFEKVIDCVNKQGARIADLEAIVGRREP
jgi:hypothetical protein